MVATPYKHLVITPGEPAGIGPDVVIQMAQRSWPAALTVIADPDLLQQRAAQLQLPLSIQRWHENETLECHRAGSLKVLPVTLAHPVQPGQLDSANATYVMHTLETAARLCLYNKADALVTGPVHKAIINDAGILFSGHTEYLAQCAQAPLTVMMFVVDALKVALVTTHLPLAQVPKALTRDRLHATLALVHDALQQHFKLTHPRIAVCGLNPHAGEGGHLGHEERDVITPVIHEYQQKGWAITGPHPADTAFTPTQLQHCDMIVAMYHDQALPVIKHVGFDRAVNVTLGLPFIRTSVDHGTALNIAGKGLADAGSLCAAVQLAIDLN